MEESIRFAKKYLEDMLSFFGLNIDVYATHEDDVIELSVPSSRMNGFLIGQRGDTMRAMQFMVSSALKNNDYELNRVNVDVADYKKNRHERLAEKVEVWIKEVVDKKEDKHVQALNAADRRIVHKVAGEDSRVESHSEGEGRDRHVILSFVEHDDPDPDDEDEDTEKKSDKETSPKIEKASDPEDS